ncbi:MAG: hypothetical protein AB7S78_14285 [Candidatus Omnitrophota bacterium]
MPPKPFSYESWPATKKIADPENRRKKGLEIRDNYLSPRGARMSLAMTGITGLIVSLDMVNLNTIVEKEEFVFFAVAGVIAFIFVTKKFFNWLFSWTLWMRIFDDRIEVARWSGFTRFAPRKDCVFRADAHEKAMEEETQYRQNPKVGRYFSNCRDVFLDFDREPVYLACIYPARKAEAFLGRVNRIQNEFNLGKIR